MSLQRAACSPLLEDTQFREYSISNRFSKERVSLMLFPWKVLSSTDSMKMLIWIYYGLSLNENNMSIYDASISILKKLLTFIPGPHSCMQ